MCILAFIVMEDFMLIVCCTKMDKVRPLNPKMVIIVWGSNRD